MHENRISLEIKETDITEINQAIQVLAENYNRC